MLFVVIRVPRFTHIACACAIIQQPSHLDCTRVACAFVKTRKNIVCGQESEFESEFEPFLVDSPRSPPLTPPSIQPKTSHQFCIRPLA
jgi:hypothetical protein